MAHNFIQLNLHGKDEKLSVVFVNAGLIKLPLPELQQDGLTEILVGSQSHPMVAPDGRMQVTQTPIEIAKKLADPDMVLASETTISHGNGNTSTLLAQEIEFIRDLRLHGLALQFYMKDCSMLCGSRIIPSHDGQQTSRPRDHLRLVTPAKDYRAG